MHDIVMISNTGWYPDALAVTRRHEASQQELLEGPHLHRMLDQSISNLV